jgi:methionine synthase II (cobalamin-independent)
MGPAIVITRTILIEDLVNQIPESVSYLLKKGIKCLACGEPVWGTLEEAAREKGFSDADLDTFVVELQALSIQRDQ